MKIKKRTLVRSKAKLSMLMAIAMIISVFMSVFPTVSAAAAPIDPTWGAAEWIWGSSNPGTTAADNRNTIQYFRRDFTLSAKPATAEINIAADTKYWMWINGEEAVWEGQLVRGPTGPSHSANSATSGGFAKRQTSPRNDSSYFDTVDIAGYLKAGANTICILVWHWNNTSTHNNPSRYGGLLLESNLADTANAGAAVSTGDGKWQTVKSPAHNTTVAPIGQASLNPTPNITYDAGVDFDWINPAYNSFTADGWVTATTYGPPGGTDTFYGWGPLMERPIPLWKDYGRFDLKANDKILFSSPAPQTDWVNYPKSPPLNDIANRFTFPTGFNAQNSRWIIGVLPYNMQMVGFIELSADTPAGQQIYVRSEPYNQSSTQNVFVTKAGAQLLEGLNWFNGEFLFFLVPNTITDDMILGLGSRETGHDFELSDHYLDDFRGHFDSVVKADDPSVVGINVTGIAGVPTGTTELAFSGGHTWGNPSYKISDEGPTPANNFYDELWKKAVRCMYVTMRDSYYDCPDRERGQYIGDAVNEFEESYYSLGTDSYDMIAKAYSQHADWQWEFEWDGTPGRTYYAMSNVRPGILTQEIYTQSLTAIYSLNDYWKFVGDAELIQHVWPKYFNYLTNWELSTPDNSQNYYGNLRRTRPQGDPPGYSTLSDWCDWGNNQDKYAFYTVIYYMAAKSVYELANDPATGVSMTADQKAFLEQQMGSIEENFEKFWDPSVRAYRSTMGGSHDGQANWSQTSNQCGLDVDDRVNALGVVSGLIPPERYQDMRDLFMGGGIHTAPHENASIYLEKYVQEALYLMGYPDDAMYRMARRHIRIVNSEHWTSLPEHWGNFWYGTVTGQGTKNHGWSGGSMIAMSRRATGVEPTAAGYSEWRVIPQMANFLEIDCKVPAVIGDIDVLLKRDEDLGTLDMTVTSPGEDAEFWVPVEEGQEAVQIAGQKAEYLGVKEAYGREYSVYSSSSAGTYSFAVGYVLAEISGPETLTANSPASYTISLENAKGAGVVTLSFTADSRYLDLPESTALNGFTILDPLVWEYVGSQMWKGSVKLYCPGFVQNNAPMDVLIISGATRDLLGDTTVTLTGFTVTGDFYGFSGAKPSFIKTAEAATSIGKAYSKYDLNHDGRIDELDLAIVVYYYLANDLEADWEVVKFDIASAKDCDVALNGRVDLADMIEVIANYADSY
ncbi:MAG: hypothetical protein FWH55_11555 [Oscillospiraceae bacterium]|nr:hypothetical protein [Oscillospiraceae bacterium]